MSTNYYDMRDALMPKIMEVMAAFENQIKASLLSYEIDAQGSGAELYEYSNAKFSQTWFVRENEDILVGIDIRLEPPEDGLDFYVAIDLTGPGGEWIKTVTANRTSPDVDDMLSDLDDLFGYLPELADTAGQFMAQQLQAHKNAPKQR